MKYVRSSTVEKKTKLPRPAGSDWIDWLNGVLRRFQQYFSHMMATVQIINVFPGFHQY